MNRFRWLLLVLLAPACMPKPADPSKPKPPKPDAVCTQSARYCGPR